MYPAFKKLLVVTLLCNTIAAGELSPRLLNVEFEVEGPQNRALKLQYDGDDFRIMNPDNGEVKTIQQYNLHRDLRGLDTHRLRIMALNSRFVAREDSNGEYTLIHYPRMKGGMMISALIVGWVSRAVGYGVPVALAATTVAPLLPAVTATGGVASAVGGASAVTTATAFSTGTAAVMGGTVASGVGAELVGATVVGAVGTAAATDAVVTGVVASTGFAGGYVGMVESVSNYLSALAFACPWLP